MTKTQLFEVRTNKTTIATFGEFAQAEDYLLARGCYKRGYFTHCNWYKDGEDGVAAVYGDMASNPYEIARVTK